MTNDHSGMVASERAALALFLVAQRPMTTAAVARRLGVTTEGARVMLTKISRVVPITDLDGVWYYVKKGL